MPAGSLRFQVQDLQLSWSPMQGRSHDLAVHRGETVFLCGPSGAGKSSFLRALVGFAPYRSGTLTVDGEELSRISAPAYRRRVQLVPQRAPRPEATLAGFLERIAHDRGLDAIEVQAVAGRLDLDAAAGRPCRELSEGEWQRFLLALAITLEPAVLLLDEPVAPLDTERSRKVRGELERLTGHRGTALIWAAHERPDHAGDARVLVAEPDGLVEATP